MRITRLVLCASSLLLSLALTACGGGGGGGSGTSSAAATPSTTTQSPSITSTAANQIAVGVTAATGAINMPTVSVTICAPGSTTNCQTITNVLLDTGSSGLRLPAGVLNSTIMAALPQSTQNSQPLAECAQFGIGNAWGGVRTANIQMAGEIASSIPVQIVNDPAIPVAPSGCNTAVAPYGNANGLPGISVFQQDCGAYCAQVQANATYFTCQSGACQATTLPTAQQVGNPVAAFPGDNNGTILAMAAIPGSGQTTASGTLTFGIGTQSDNSPATTSQFYAVSPTTGYFQTAYAGQNLSSFLDTGSNVLFFQDSSIPQCSQFPGYYCPASTTNLNTQITSASGTTSSAVTFALVNAQNAANANPSYAALPGIGVYRGGSIFDWGFPFYYGRSVSTVIEGRATSLGTGPGVIF